MVSCAGSTRRRAFFLFPLAFFLFFPPLALGFDVDDPPRGVFADEWYAVMIDGRKTGHMHSKMERLNRRSGDIVRSRTEMELTAGRAAASITVSLVQQTEETLDGQPLSFHHTMRMGMFPTTTQGRIRDGRVSITTSQFGQQGKTATYPLPEGAMMSWGSYREQIRRGLEPGTTYELPLYEPTMAADRLTPARVEILGREMLDLFGRKVEAIKSRQTMRVQGLLGRGMDLQTVTWLKEDGSIVRLEMNLLNIPIEIVACSRTIATAPNDPAELMLDTLVPVSEPIDAKADRITYRLSFRSLPDGGELPDLPETAMQTVDDRQADAITLTVTRLSARRDRSRSELTPEERERYLEPASAVNYKDPVVAELARKAAGDEKDPRKLAERLVQFVNEYIEDKSLNVGFATASEVARSREGDCTEHGVLLAALGRAVGIPTRVVTGMVYADAFEGRRQVFVGHLWTQFWLEGEWVDVDASLRQVDVNPTHIALSVSAAGDTGMADMVGSLWLSLGNFKLSVVHAE